MAFTSSLFCNCDAVVDYKSRGPENCLIEKWISLNWSKDKRAAAAQGCILLYQTYCSRLITKRTFSFSTKNEKCKRPCLATSHDFRNLFLPCKISTSLSDTTNTSIYSNVCSMYIDLECLSIIFCSLHFAFINCLILVTSHTNSLSVLGANFRAAHKA